ncbi:MAG: hypothetical protein ACREYD_14395 [Casimicrobiaceae bacterium]
MASVTLHVNGEGRTIHRKAGGAVRLLRGQKILQPGLSARG